MRTYQAIPLSTGALVELNAFASHHIAQVMRAKVNDELTIFNGQGGEYRALIVAIQKKKVTLEIKEFVAREMESPIDIYLAQGISRGEKMDFTIQKAVELGVKKILPLFSERSTVKLDEKRAKDRLLHWQTIVLTACEQCGRNRLPEVLPPVNFKQGLSILSADWQFILLPEAPTHLQELIGREAPPKNLLLLIGPEGGFSEKEIEQAKQHAFEPLALGPRILRTETAALAALSIFQSHWGDMQ